MEHEEYMRQALELARQAMAEGRCRWAASLCGTARW